MLQIAICDNDRMDLTGLESLVNKIMKKYAVRYQIVTYDSGEELLETSLMFHLILMNVRVDGGTGIEIGKKLCRRNRATKMILHAEPGEYSVEMLNKSHAFAFLEKPVKEEVLEEQLREFLELQENIQELWMLFRHIKKEGNVEKETLRIPIREILYFENHKTDNSIKVVTERGIFEHTGIMSKLEKKMKPFGFEICCRGLLVNLDKVERIKKGSIQLCNGDVLPLSQRRNACFRERIEDFA